MSLISNDDYNATLDMSHVSEATIVKIRTARGESGYVCFITLANTWQRETRAK